MCLKKLTCLTSKLQCFIICNYLQATVMKKRMYYNMRVKTVHRNMMDILSKMDIYKTKLEEFPHERIKCLYNVLKEVSIILV